MQLPSHNLLRCSRNILTALLSVLLFILIMLLLSADFYYLKNIAGRRLVGLRWWNEVDASTGDSQWVFESAEPGTKNINATDTRFFWLALYAQPLYWIALGIVAIVRFEFIYLMLVGKYVFTSAMHLSIVKLEKRRWSMLWILMEVAITADMMICDRCISGL